MNRRNFLNQAGLGSLLLYAGNFPLEVLESGELTKITILHTNDVHSRIDPFPMDGSRNAGQGGAARRKALIDSVRSAEPNVVLLDAGDIYQGTPYFNYFKGELEFKLMTEMGYDAATLGNHDFDATINQLANNRPLANFPFIVSNYDFSDTPMNGLSKPYMIIEKAGIKIGVLSANIELEGLVPKAWYGDTQWLDPVANANKYAKLLREEEKCDFVICLSHLGYQYRDEKISDVKLASLSKNIDLIIGGHTHTFMKEPRIISNLDGKPVFIHQAGWGGILLGKVDLLIERNRRKVCVNCTNLPVGEVLTGEN